MRVYPLTKELCLKVDNFFDAITRKTKLNETTVVVAMIVYIKSLKAVTCSRAS